MANDKENPSPMPGVSEGEGRVRINFRIPARMPSVYASHFFVQETEDEVVLSFFELIHPIIPPGISDESKQQTRERIQELGVGAECVSRITIAKHKLPSLAYIINEAAERFIHSMEEFEKQEAEERKNADD